MALGPGKYDDLCTLVRERAEALAAIVIVMGGNKGGGFAVQGPLSFNFALPETLEGIAKQIRADRAASGMGVQPPPGPMELFELLVEGQRLMPLGTRQRDQWKWKAQALLARGSNGL